MQKKYNRLSGIFLLVIITGIGACRKLTTDSSEPLAAELAGACTVYDETSYAFTYRINGLSDAQTSRFFVGNSLFNQNWVFAPSSTTARDGLGPLFNAKSCSSCHFRDGRGVPVKNLGLLFRVGTSSSGGGIADLIYGGQLQDHSHSDTYPEGDMTINYTEISGTYPDGTPYSLRMPSYSISGLNFGSLTATGISPRVAQQMIGLGLLEIIPEAQLLANADPYDINNDGISGKPNYVADVVNGGISIGRFGWKANQPSILQQVAAAFNGDIGITSYLFPNENWTSSEGLSGLPNGGTPEIETDDLNAVALYSRTLAVPAQRNVSTVLKGMRLFDQVQCTACHKASFKTGTAGDIQPLKNVRIRPYTDLLLHDMGPDLADGLEDFEASGNEWRTPPLWGIGLIKTVNSHTYLLHDGRARTIEEAILWHGGEAKKSKLLFMKLLKTDREAILKFLNSI